MPVLHNYARRFQNYDMLLILIAIMFLLSVREYFT